MTTPGTFVVIGSNCFTGSHIVAALLEHYPEYQVVGISRSPEVPDLYLPYKRHDLRRFRFHQLHLVHQTEPLLQLLDKLRPPVVINVAALSEVALSNERPVEYFETNTLGVVRLCNHLRTQPYSGASTCISPLPRCTDPAQGSVTEEILFNPSTPYAVSKAAADLYLNTLLRNFQFPATLIRSTNVYGKHQQLFKIIPRTVIFLKQGKTIELHGGGSAVKSFVHIRDVVAGLLATIRARSLGTFHFSVPSERTVADVVRLICTSLGRDFDQSTRVVGERLGQDGRYSLDCSRAAEELHWSPQVGFEEGVGEVVDWIEANWSAVQAHPLHYIHKYQSQRAA